MSAADWWDIDRDPATLAQRRALHSYGYETRLIDMMTKNQAREAIQFAVRVRKLHELDLMMLRKQQEREAVRANNEQTV